MTYEQQSEGGKKERSGVLTVAVVCVLVLPALYLFATGPMIALVHRGYISDSTFQVIDWIYAPLMYIVNSNDTLRELYGEWASLWR
jgi:dolichol kinase